MAARLTSLTKEGIVNNYHLRILLVGAAVLMASAGPGRAVPTRDADCLGCHGSPERFSQTDPRLYVDPNHYKGTTHALIGCRACHDSVTAAHPRDGLRPSKANCKECHAPVYAEYARSLHGRKAACADCHDPHAARPPEAVAGADINSRCTRCHDLTKTIKSHDKWLPQADLHMDALPCITCHTGSRNYVITLYIQNRQSGGPRSDFKLAGYGELARLAPTGREISTLLDRDGNGVVSLEELRDFNRKGRGRDMRLWGMMTPEVVTHSYQTLDNRWDCSFCHASGPRALQTSYLAFPDRTGGYTRLPVEKGAILDILYGTPDFYMLGTTRSTPLNLVGAAILACGMLFPIGHGTFRFLTRKNRKEH